MPVSFSFLVWPPWTANLVIWFYVLLLSSKSTAGFRYQPSVIHLANEVTLPSRLNRRQSTERNATISYGFLPSNLVTAWVVCCSKHPTNKLCNILLVRVQWKTEAQPIAHLSLLPGRRWPGWRFIYLLHTRKQTSITSHKLTRVYSLNYLIKSYYFNTKQ